MLFPRIRRNRPRHKRPSRGLFDAAFLDPDMFSMRDRRCHPRSYSSRPSPGSCDRMIGRIRSSPHHAKAVQSFCSFIVEREREQRVAPQPGGKAAEPTSMAFVSPDARDDRILPLDRLDYTRKCCDMLVVRHGEAFPGCSQRPRWHRTRANVKLRTTRPIC
jgi:hypothetical protein